ncbi:MAG: hypothetical protein ACI90V_013445, partial [Bacillariaceae sp.]
SANSGVTNLVIREKRLFSFCLASLRSDSIVR